MTDHGTDVTVADLTVERVDSDEYDYAVAVRARLDGPSGPRAVRRRYEALPRHNDVLAGDAVDSNDELTDRPDEVHVHTRYYDGEAYRGDRHDAWRPTDASILSDEERFRDACREHFRRRRTDVYERAPAERE